VEGGANLYRRTAQFYDLDWYADLSASDVPFYLRYARAFGRDVLDLACGTGRVAIPLAGDGHTVVGLDLSEEMLEQFRRKRAALPAQVRERISMVCSDMCEFDLGRKFSLIVIPARSFQALLSEERQRQCLRRIRSHLREDGILILTALDMQRLVREPAFAMERKSWEKPLQGGGTVTKFVRGKGVEQDGAVVHLEAIYRVSMPGEPAQEIRETMSLSSLTCEQLGALLQTEQLRIASAYGGYDRRPVRPGSDTIVVCRHTGTRAGLLTGLRRLFC
jgi:SAM-dependent methyltransferase